MATSFNGAGLLNLIRSGAIRRNDDDYTGKHESLPSNVDPETRSGDTTQAQSPLNVGPLPTNNRVSADDLRQMAPPAPTPNLARSPVDMGPGPWNSENAYAGTGKPAVAPSPADHTQPNYLQGHDNDQYQDQAKSPLDVLSAQPPPLDLSNVRQLDPNRTTTGLVRPNENQYQSGMDSRGNTIGRGRGFFAGFARGLAGGPIMGLMNGIAGLVDPNYGREQVFQRDNAKFTAQKQQDLAQLNEDPVQKAQLAYAVRSGEITQETARAIAMSKLTQQNKLELQDDKYDHIENLQDTKDEAALARVKMRAASNESIKKMVIDAAIKKGPESAALYVAYANGRNYVTPVDRAVAGQMEDEYRQSKTDKNEQPPASQTMSANTTVGLEMKPFDDTVSKLNKQIAAIDKNDAMTPAMKTAEKATLKTQLDKATADRETKKNELEQRFGGKITTTTSTAQPTGKTGVRKTGTARRGAPSSKNIGQKDVEGFAKDQNITPEEAERQLRAGGYIIKK